MATVSSIHIDESTLTKGQRRKLNALRKSVGNEVGEKAFSEWLAQQDAGKGQLDANAALSESSLPGPSGRPTVKIDGAVGRLTNVLPMLS